MIIVGSGFGGSMAANALIGAGLDVLMLERGDWVVRGPRAWDERSTLDLTPVATSEPPYRVLAGGTGPWVGPYSCVGGASVFFGGVTIRFREDDFRWDPNVAPVPASWPYDYAELEPYYTMAEELLGVAGDREGDPTEPFHSAPYPQPPSGLSATSQMIKEAAASLGLHPFRLPLAINYQPKDGRSACVACTTCDTFACAIGAKNDLAACVLPGLIRNGLRIETGCVATRLLHERGAVIGVECYDKRTWVRRVLRASVYVVAAGALGSPHLLLSSELERVNPAGELVGRNLMRHCNAIVFGVFARRPNQRREFHKQIGINDFYFGHPSIEQPPGKLGTIQQTHAPPVGLVKHIAPPVLGTIISPAIAHMTGLLVMAEDQPQQINRVQVDWSDRDLYGLPRLTIDHHYTARDYAARRVLGSKAKMILRHAGARVTYVHSIKTFSHAAGTLRFGSDPHTSVLDPMCRFRGLANLYFVDASFMPTSAGVNPSLTISANALRVGEAIARS